MSTMTDNGSSSIGINSQNENKYITRVAFGEDFTANSDILKWIMDNGDGKLANQPAGSNNVPSTAEDINNIIDSLPQYSRGIKHRDTYVGGNDAVNSYYQFCEFDDIVHPVNMTNSGGMGRVYNETFDQNQQLLYLSFGVPDFTNAGTFIRDAYDTSLSKLMNSGDVGFAGSIGKFLGETLGTVIKLPFIPIRWEMDRVTLGAAPAVPTKYYDFNPKMALYYKTVNVMMATVAVNMNLAGIADATTLAAVDPVAGIPEVLKKHGLDILSILSRKNQYDNDKNPAMDQPKTDDFLKQGKDNPNYEQGIWSRLLGGLEISLTDAMFYVGFRIEKSTSSSETGSSSTKEPDFLGMINSKVATGKERSFNVAALKNATGSLGSGVIDFFSQMSSGVADSLDLTGGLEILKGSGYLDVPELWNTSQFTKSYSFDFQLRTPYGDPVSVFYSLYIPLFLLIAGAFPRSVGQNSFTSPFLVRAYSQGMFAIPMGIIDSINIRRGNAEYGWAKGSGNMLPTEIDVSITIKDLSPIMHLAISDGSDMLKQWMNILGANSTFQEYLLTLSGINISQRALLFKQFAARKKALLTMMSNNKFNPLMFGFSVGSTTLGRMISKLTPVSRLPGNTSSTTPNANKVPAPNG